VVPRCPYCDQEMKLSSREGVLGLRERFFCAFGDPVEIEVTRFGGFLAGTWIRLPAMPDNGGEWLTVQDVLRHQDLQELWRPPKD
jgi:hypothetical protein